MRARSFSGDVFSSTAFFQPAISVRTWDANRVFLTAFQPTTPMMP